MGLEQLINYGKKEFILQWHITNECDMRCSHCYIPHSEKKKSDSISLERSYGLIQELADLGERWSTQTRINFSGGNPILHENFFDLANYASKIGIRIGVLGNPSSVLDEDTLQRLKQIPVFRYQISIDGLEEHHEKIRGKHTYQNALKALDCLVENKIPAVVLTTVTKENLDQIPELAKIVFEKGVTVFDFSRIVPSGEAKDWTPLLPKPNEYREFLLNMFNTYLEIKENIPIARFGVKDPLWMLLYKELGILKPIKDMGKIYGGCSVGMNGFCLDVDGTAYSCRRVEIPIGNAKEQNLYDLFIKSEQMNNEREFERIKGCSDCELLTICRGCRAISYHANKDYFTKDPSCWKK